jgi:hypothetical protein
MAVKFLLAVFTGTAIDALEIAWITIRSRDTEYRRLPRGILRKLKKADRISDDRCTRVA